MRNIRILLQYDGSRYQGWQKQVSTDNTIQGKLETLLTKMCGEPIEVQASGRTDAGVHARGQVANFHTGSTMELGQMQAYMNQYLPEDIAVLQVTEAAPRFHSRLNACGKKYRYLLVNSAVQDVFLRKYAWQYPEKLNLEEMRKATQFLCGEHDFKAFTSTKKSKKSTVRNLYQITIEQRGDVLEFTFEGNGFLHHMVRILMGTLLEVGTGQRKAESIPELFAEGRRADSGILVPAKGLTLLEVYYD